MWKRVFCVFVCTITVYQTADVNIAQISCYPSRQRAFVNDCYHEIKLHVDMPVNITSPGFPCTFPRSFSCHWKLQAPRGHFIRIEILVFDLPESDENEKCHVAYLEYGHYDHKYRRVADTNRRCGTKNPKKIVSLNNTYWLSLTSHWYPEAVSYKGISLQLEITNQTKARIASDPTVVAICAFLVPLFCAFPVYHCFKRMAQVNKRKRIQARIQRLRELDRRNRKSVVSSGDGLSTTVSVGEDTSSVFYTIWEESGESVPSKGEAKTCEKNNNISVSRCNLSASDSELHKVCPKDKAPTHPPPALWTLSQVSDPGKPILSSLNHSSPALFLDVPTSTPFLMPPTSLEGTPNRPSFRKSVTFTETDLVFRYHTPSEPR